MAKGQKKRCASDGGNTADKSHKRSSAEGDDNKNKDAGTNGAPGDGKPLTATDGCVSSSTKGNGTMTPHDRDQRPTYRKMQILIRAWKATTIKTKTQAQMERLGMANVWRWPMAVTRQAQKATTQQHHMIAMQRPTYKKMQILMHVIIAMQRQTNRKMQVQNHSQFSKPQFGTLQ